MTRLSLLCLVVFISCFLGCDGSAKRIAELEEQLGAVGKKLTDVVNDPKIPIEEWKKLRQIEYSVVSLPAGSGEDTIVAKLNDMGKERWDCQALPVASFANKDTSFDSHLGGPLVRFMCKRMPETPLRYVPTGWLR